MLFAVVPPFGSSLGGRCIYYIYDAVYIGLLRGGSALHADINNTLLYNSFCRFAVSESRILRAAMAPSSVPPPAAAASSSSRPEAASSETWKTIVPKTPPKRPPPVPAEPLPVKKRKEMSAHEETQAAVAGHDALQTGSGSKASTISWQEELEIEVEMLRDRLLDVESSCSAILDLMFRVSRH